MSRFRLLAHCGRVTGAETKRRDPRRQGSSPGRTVVSLASALDDAALVEAVIESRPGAVDALLDRYGRDVERVLVRVVGPGSDHADHCHDVWVRALEGLPRLKDPSRLRSWLVGIAVRYGRETLRRRAWRRRFIAWIPGLDASADDLEASAALRRTYALLDALPVDERVAFALRQLEEMKVAEIAEVTGASVATVKRRVRRATERIERLAAEDPLLSHLVRER